MGSKSNKKKRRKERIRQERLLLQQQQQGNNISSSNATINSNSNRSISSMSMSTYGSITPVATQKQQQHHHHQGINTNTNTNKEEDDSENDNSSNNNNNNDNNDTTNSTGSATQLLLVGNNNNCNNHNNAQHHHHHRYDNNNTNNDNNNNNSHNNYPNPNQNTNLSDLNYTNNNTTTNTTIPNSSIDLLSNRIRSLPLVTFVYPKDITTSTSATTTTKLQPIVYTFGNDNTTTTTTATTATTEKTDNTAKQQKQQYSHTTTHETIDDILYSSKKDNNKNNNNNKFQPITNTTNTTMTLSKSNNDVVSGKMTTTFSSITATDTATTIQTTPITVTTTSILKQQQQQQQHDLPQTTLQSQQQQSQSQQQRHVSYCLLSGISVEEAVRDKVGLRPRANSTDDELKLPQRGLCDERYILEWYKWRLNTTNNNNSNTIDRICINYKIKPKGLNNLGNTCFLNSTLQCLAYCPPFCQSLMNIAPQSSSSSSQQQSRKVNQGKQFTLLLGALFRRMHTERTDRIEIGALSPRKIVTALPLLGSSSNIRRNGYKFRPGRQEDAHEFLVHLLDSMNDGELREAGIDANKSGWRDRLPVPRLDETTFVHRIFGGYFRSQVQCTDCNYRSNTYDPFLDLSLEISRNSCHSISSAIHHFTRKETLDAQNRWKCSGCKKRVCATKQLTVFRPPLVLCIQLKRFTYGGGGGGGFYGGGGGKKVTKPIEFPAQLQLPLSDGRSCGYVLTGLVIHIGGSANSGHYTAYVQRPNLNGDRMWYHMDDSFVQPVSEQHVLRQHNAYVIMYCRQEVKIEFPTPPLRGSMTADEAKHLAHLRHRARSNSTGDIITENSEQRSGNITTDTLSTRRANERNRSNSVSSLTGNDNNGTTTIITPRIQQRSRSNSLSILPGDDSGNSKVIPHAMSNLESTKTHGTTKNNNPQQRIRSNSLSSINGNVETKKSHVSHVTNGKDIDNTIESNAPYGHEKINIRHEMKHTSKNTGVFNMQSKPLDPSLKKSPIIDSKVSVHQSLSKEASKSSNMAMVPQQSDTNKHETKIHSKDNNNAPMLLPPTLPTTSKEEEQQQQQQQRQKQLVQVTVDRGGSSGKVQVVMRSANTKKSHAERVWVPKTVQQVEKDEAYDLLGNIPVSKWDDDDNDIDSDKKIGNGENEASRTQLSSSDDVITRTAITKQLQKIEKDRKRKMFLDRHDAILDQGKMKKVKKNKNTNNGSSNGSISSRYNLPSTSATSLSSSPHTNVFQRLHGLKQKMGLQRR